MKSLNNLSHEYLINILDYNKDTGVFTFKIPRGKKNTPFKLGTIAGTKRPDGYLQLKINYKIYFLHRLAWFYTYKKWPINEIDHIDSNKSNNAINNLQDITHLENMRKRKLKAKEVIE